MSNSDWALYWSGGDDPVCGRCRECGRQGEVYVRPVDQDANRSDPRSALVVIELCAHCDPYSQVWEVELEFEWEDWDGPA